jgi:uncharacterized damage-inducible protein DinB
MISITKSLEHMAWSNQQIFKALSELPEEIYGLRAAEGEWPVGGIVTHFLNAAEWYRYILTEIRWTDIEPIKSHEILRDSAVKLAEMDQVLIAQSLLSDDEISFLNENGPDKTRRVVVLSQALSHTAEHKGQLATILKMHGYHLDLDALDHWTFVNI